MNLIAAGIVLQKLDFFLDFVNARKSCKNGQKKRDFGDFIPSDKGHSHGSVN